MVMQLPVAIAVCWQRKSGKARVSYTVSCKCHAAVTHDTVVEMSLLALLYARGRIYQDDAA